MQSKLIEIPPEQWTALRDLYEQHKRYASSYSLLQNMINWKLKNSQIDIKIYSLNGEWQNDGTFLLEIFDQLYCNTKSDDLNRLSKALSCLDSSVKREIIGIRERILPAIQQYFQYLNLPAAAFQPTSILWFHIAKEKAAAFSIPKNMIFAPLTELNVEQINSKWPHRKPGSEHFVKALIDYNESVGIFENGKLVAWSLMLLHGSPGLLQVEETHRRNGLGSLVVRYMSKLLASKNLEVCAAVVASNTASRNMFEKLGFQIIDTVYYVSKPAIF